MTGQMTYTIKTKSWDYIPLNAMTRETCYRANKIQSRKGYFLAWAGVLTNMGTLSDMIQWVENTSH